MIKITLSSGGMGGISEDVFAAWARHVRENHKNIEGAIGVTVDQIDQFRFGDPGGDIVNGGDYATREKVRAWLRDTWEEFEADILTAYMLD